MIICIITLIIRSVFIYVSSISVNAKVLPEMKKKMYSSQLSFMIQDSLNHTKKMNL